jgi:hypothetical protein
MMAGVREEQKGGVTSLGRRPSTRKPVRVFTYSIAAGSPLSALRRSCGRGEGSYDCGPVGCGNRGPRLVEPEKKFGSFVKPVHFYRLVLKSVYFSIFCKNWSNFIIKLIHFYYKVDQFYNKNRPILQRIQKVDRFQN